MKILELFVAKDGRFFEDEQACIDYEKDLPEGEPPYIYKGLNSQDKAYNPKYNDDAKCECGHPYYRHFDSYENIAKDVSSMSNEEFESYLLEVYSEENGHFDQENVHAMIEEIKNAI